jgi:hypothetical protein
MTCDEFTDEFNTEKTKNKGCMVNLLSNLRSLPSFRPGIAYVIDTLYLAPTVCASLFYDSHPIDR